MAVTLRQVAQATGLTYQTVGHVLNPSSPRRHLYSESTRQQVLDAAERLGYVRNRIASSMARQRSHTLGVVGAFSRCESIQALGGSHYFMSVLAGVEAITGAAGYNCLFVTSEVTDPEHFVPPRAMQDGSVDGVVLVGYTKQPILEKIAALGLPCVQVGSNMDRVGTVPRVYADLGLAFEQVAQRLVALGHRRIALLLDVGPGPQELGREFQALADRLPGFEPQVVYVDIQTQGQASAQILARAVLALPQRPTAVVTNSALAQELVHELVSAGVRCPEDLSLVAYGGVPHQRLFVGQGVLDLSSIELPMARTGSLSALRLLEQLDPPAYETLVGEGRAGEVTGAVAETLDWRIPCSLHWRASCIAPPGAAASGMTPA